MVRDVQPHTPIEALTGPVLRARRTQQVEGLSRRTLLRRAMGAGIGLWLLEVVGGTIAFAWSTGALATPRVRVGALADLVAANPGIPVADGFPTISRPLVPSSSSSTRPAAAGNRASMPRATARP